MNDPRTAGEDEETLMAEGNQGGTIMAFIHARGVGITASLLLGTVLVLASPALTTWHVDDDAPGDPGPGDPSVSDPLEDGSAAHPFDAIQEAINASADGDTVSVADGTYTGTGNYNISTDGTAVTVISESGPASCIVDCQGIDGQQGFLISDNGTVHGFAIINGRGFEGGGVQIRGVGSRIEDCIIRWCSATNGGGMTCWGSATVSHCLIADNDSGWYGGGIYCWDSPSFCDNIIRNNTSLFSGAGISYESYHEYDAAIISGNVIEGNTSTTGGGGGIYCYSPAEDNPVIFNNLIKGNSSGGILSEAESIIANNTIVDNQNSGIRCNGSYPAGVVTVVNTILWNNGWEMYLYNNAALIVSYSDVYGGQGSLYVEPGCSYTWGAGMISANPLFVSGPEGDHYLGQVAAGQPFNSQCVDAGSAPAGSVCHQACDGTVCMDALTTRTDRVPDGGTVDMGFHYTPGEGSTLSASLVCSPQFGTLPFTTNISVTLTNEYSLFRRRIAASMRVNMAGGQQWSNWKAGYTQLNPGAVYIRTWNQAIPAYVSLVGENVFTLFAEDVTPPPYNQPPYPPAGDQDTDTCTVTGAAP